MSLGSLLARPVVGAAITTAAILPPVLTVVLLWTTTSTPAPIDYHWFGPGGAALLTGRWGDIFGDPAVQAGPFELAPYGLTYLLGVSGHVGWTVALSVYSVITAFFAALLLRPTYRTDLLSSLLVAMGVLVIAVMGPIATWTLGHPSEVLVPLVWIAAGRCAIRGRPGTAAVLIALSSGFEVWGVLAAPMVLLAAKPRLLRSAVAGAVVLAVLWLPFVLAGPFEMFSFSWQVRDFSLLHQLDPSLTTFPWTLRLVQSAMALGAGTAVAVLVRRRDPAWGPWGVTVAVVAARIILDPLLAPYYWVPAMVGAVGALVLAARRADLPAAAASAAALLLGFDLGFPVFDLGYPIVRAVALVLLTLAAAAAIRLRARSGRAPNPSVLRTRRVALT